MSQCYFSVLIPHDNQVTIYTTTMTCTSESMISSNSVFGIEDIIIWTFFTMEILHHQDEVRYGRFARKHYNISSCTTAWWITAADLKWNYSQYKSQAMLGQYKWWLWNGELSHAWSMFVGNWSISFFSGAFFHRKKTRYTVRYQLGGFGNFLWLEMLIFELWKNW